MLPPWHVLTPEAVGLELQSDLIHGRRKNVEARQVWGMEAFIVWWCIDDQTESCMAFAAYTESQGSMKQYSTRPAPSPSRSLVLSVVSNAICLSCASNMPRGDLLEWQGDFSKRITATFRVRNTLYQKAWSGISMCRHGQGITTAYIPSFMGLKRLVFRPRYTLGIAMWRMLGSG